MNVTNAIAPSSVARTAPGRKAMGGALMGVAAVALVAGCVTLSKALEKSASIVNDPVIVTLVVNGVAAVALLVAGYLLFRKRGLLGAGVLTVAWAGSMGLLLDRALYANADKLGREWDAQRAVEDLKRICDGSTSADARAKAFDPRATQHELVVVDSGLNGSGAHVFAKQGLTIDRADLLACNHQVEKTIETCGYTDDSRARHVSVDRVQVSSTVRFIAIKTGETVWDTTLDGAPPRACGDFESVYGQRGSIVGNPPNVQGVYYQHFAAKP